MGICISSHGVFYKFTIPLGIAAILLFLIENPVLSFLLALAFACMLFPELPGNLFFVFVEKQLSYTILTILAIGGFMEVLKQSGGSAQLNIWIRKICKTLNSRKIAGIAVTIVNCFSSPATISAMHLIFKEDLESNARTTAEKESLIGIMLMFSNISCVLVPVSLWWLFFNTYSTKSDGVFFDYQSIWLFLWYPFTVCIYWIVRLWKEKQGKKVKVNEKNNAPENHVIQEILLEQRKLHFGRFICFFVLPMVLIISIIIYYGRLGDKLKGYDGLFNDKTFVLGAFVLGTLAIYMLLWVFRMFRNRFTPRAPRQIIEMADDARQQAGRLVAEMKSTRGRITGKGFVKSGAQDVLAKVIQRFNLAARERQVLNEVKVYHRYAVSGLAECFLRAFKNLTDVTKRFYDDFLTGAKSMIGTAMVLIAALALKEIMAPGENSLYPSSEECKLLFAHIPIGLMPLALFVLTTVIGLVIGTSFGAFAMMFVFISVVKTTMDASGVTETIQQDVINATIGAVISAAVFINQSSKQADNVAVTSQLTGKSSEHVLTITSKSRWYCYLLTLACYLAVSIWLYFVI